MYRKEQQLVEYYLSKDTKYLQRVEEKYKRYAEKLAKKCERTRGQVEVLYNDLKKANTMLTNAKDAARDIEKQKRLFERSQNKVSFPWCPDSGDEEDEPEDVTIEEDHISKEKNRELVARLSELKKLQVWYKDVLAPVIGTSTIDALYKEIYTTKPLEVLLNEMKQSEELIQHMTTQRLNSSAEVDSLKKDIYLERLVLSRLKKLTEPSLETSDLEAISRAVTRTRNTM